MSKIGVAPHQAQHTGKSGFIAARPVGSPKPFPFSIVEQGIINSYPEYRKYLPEYALQYSDEIYDFRSLPYKEWYDKRGKKHINRWWQQQLDAISFYETKKQEAIQASREYGNTRFKYNVTKSGCKHCNNVSNYISKHICRRKCFE